jgi:Tol biopolymer transport system component
MSHLAHDGTRRVLVLWKPAIPGVHGCPDSSLTTAGTPGPAPRTPSPLGVTLFSLPNVDGTPIAAIPSRFVSANTVEGAGTIQQRVRVPPAIRDADRTGTNVFGPALVFGADDLIYSDGERIWRASLLDTSAAPVLIGSGAYPTVSPDGRQLAYARPVGLDSVSSTYSIPVGLALCVEEQVEISAARWEVVIRDLESGAESVIGDGRDAAFDSQGSRVVVRGVDLRWVDLATMSPSPIPGTAGAFAPAVSPDGAVLAFSIIQPGTHADAFLIRLNP